MRLVPTCAVVADTWHVDNREQAFADEAVRRLNFLTQSPLGYAGPQIDQQGAGPGSTVFVSYRKGPLTLGIRLVRGHASGDDYVAIAGIVDGGEGHDAHHIEHERGKARTDRQMLRAVKKYAMQIRATTPSPGFSFPDRKEATRPNSSS